MKWVALRSGLRWPKNIQTMPELKRAIGERSETEFEVLVGAVIEKMQAMAGGKSCAPSHPMFGPMSAEDWMRLGISACGPSSAAVWPVRDDSAGGRGDRVAGVAVP